MKSDDDRKGRLPGVLADLALALGLVICVLLCVLAALGRPGRPVAQPAGVLRAVGLVPPGKPSRDMARTQRKLTGRLKQTGTVSDRTLRMVDKVGLRAAALGEKLNKTPEGREKALQQVKTMSGLVRQSSANEIKELLVDANELKALSRPEGKDIDVAHAKIQSIKKIVKDGKTIMIIVLADPRGRTQRLEITDPKEQKDYENAYKIYNAADRNPILKIGLDITNHYLQMREGSTPAPAAARQPDRPQDTPIEQKKETGKTDGSK